MALIYGQWLLATTDASWHHLWRIVCLRPLDEKYPTKDILINFFFFSFFKINTDFCIPLFLFNKISFQIIYKT